jgi:hypothetical protein
MLRLFHDPTMNLPRLLLTILAGMTATLQAEDQPAPRGNGAPIGALIGKDQNGYPTVAKENMPAVAEWVMRTKGSSEQYSWAVWGLAISGYSPESAQALMATIEDTSRSEPDRGHAAMGLGNFTSALAPAEKDALKARLRKTLQTEKTKPPDGIIRTLLAWKDAPWLLEVAGERLRGSSMEVEILAKSRSDKAVPRLLEIYGETEPTTVLQSYYRRAEIGRAVVELKDKRGIDILATLLPKSSVEDGPSGKQSRNNVFWFLMLHTGRDFEYEYVNYDESLEPAIERFQEWWAQERSSFSFPAEPSRFPGKQVPATP